MLISKKASVWVGITDAEQEGVWRFVTDKTVFDANKGNTLNRWAAGEPNNGSGGQHCAVIWHKNVMDDYNCVLKVRGLCEIKNY